MHVSPPGLESRAGRQRRPEVPVAPPGARAFPPEFPFGSSDSRSKLNILGQGEASCQVPALHGVLPPPPPPPPTPPPPNVPAATSRPNTSSIAETAALRLLLVLPPPADASSAAPFRAHFGRRRKWLFHAKRY